MDAAAGVPGSRVVTAMTRNGREFGIRVSGSPIDGSRPRRRSSTACISPAIGPDDADPDLGDSAITETDGDSAASPWRLRRPCPVRRRHDRGVARITQSMTQITLRAATATFSAAGARVPGTPLGIDAREVVHTGILPVINTGIAHRSRVGQIGAGVVRPPMEPFVHALEALADAGQTALSGRGSLTGGPP